jgi:hypothetical protein
MFILTYLLAALSICHTLKLAEKIAIELGPVHFGAFVLEPFRFGESILLALMDALKSYRITSESNRILNPSSLVAKAMRSTLPEELIVEIFWISHPLDVLNAQLVCILFCIVLFHFFCTRLFHLSLFNIICLNA